MRRGLRTAAGEDDQTVASTPTVVKHFRCGTSVVAVDSCQDTGRGSRGQGRQPRAARAQRNRGRAQSLERTSCEPHNHRATGRKIATWICTRSRSPRCTNPTTTFRIETQTAWRERPPRWPRAWRPRGSKMVVAHATVLGLTTSLAVSHLSGGTKRRPMRPSGNSQH